MAPQHTPLAGFPNTFFASAQEQFCLHHSLFAACFSKSAPHLVANNHIRTSTIRNILYNTRDAESKRHPGRLPRVTHRSNRCRGTGKNGVLERRGMRRDGKALRRRRRGGPTSRRSRAEKLGGAGPAEYDR